MRILILSNSDMGLYKFRRELLEELARDNEVFFCVPAGEYIGKLKKIGCQFIPCDVLNRRSVNPVKDLKLIRLYCKTLSKIKPDVVLTFTIKPNVYGGLMCTMKGVPYISNITGLGTSIENGGILAKISLVLYKIGIRDASCVFFQNEDNLKLFTTKRVASRKTKLLPGSGVSLTAYNYELYPSDKDMIRFLFVGRIMKDKGIEELLKATIALQDVDKKVQLDIVGPCEENYMRELQDAQNAGIVLFHGVQEDVRPFYKNCHCVVLPSYHEGMANVMLEASATGRPVITTTVPGCLETFDEGVTGFGCKAKNAESLLLAMRRFVSLSPGERVKMGKNARAKMEKEFDRQIVTDAYKAEIEKIYS